jgi:hypothetical protein
MTTPPEWQPPGQPPIQPPDADGSAPPPEPGRRRRRRWPIFTEAAGAVVAVIVLVALMSSRGTSTGGTPASTATAPDPHASGTGTCGVLLDPSLGSNDYLTAFVTVHNTGNVGEVVRVRVTWPQVGFADVVRHKSLRVPWHATRHVSLRVPTAALGHDAVGAFQDTPDYQHGNDPCSYRLTLVSTFGTAH